VRGSRYARNVQSIAARPARRRPNKNNLDGRLLSWLTAEARKRPRGGSRPRSSRDKGPLLNEDTDRLGRAFILRPRFLAEAPHVPFNLVGGVLNFVRRATFDAFDQARNNALQYDKILAKQCDIRIRFHRCAHDLQVSHRPEVLR
jgi:hypothetical protein